jgi:hypothetical protein
VDAGKHSAKLVLVVVVITRSFKDWKWPNPWQYNLGLFSEAFELWGKANKNCVLSITKWWCWLKVILADSGLTYSGKL